VWDCTFAPLAAASRDGKHFVTMMGYYWMFGTVIKMHRFCSDIFKLSLLFQLEYNQDFFYAVICYFVFIPLDFLTQVFLFDDF